MSPNEPPRDAREGLTVLLERARTGDDAARDAAFGEVYRELRRIAAAQMRGRAPGQTLQATAVVHEAYLRLVGREAPWESRSHFFCVAAQAMRSVLVDHARARTADKRGGGRRREPLHEAAAWFEERSIDLVALDDALDALGAFDPRLRRHVELRFFAGLTVDRVAQLQGVSVATAERDWALARTWLHRRMSGAGGAP
jgi:RNA polymerase sigma-70 factor, ECF subfamily